MSEDCGGCGCGDETLSNAGVGIQGPAGPQGFQGLQGIKGNQGTTGSQGVQGTSVQGTSGLVGAQGVQGLQGFIGSTGIQGANGLQGIQGVQGAQGRLGLQGIQGFVGLQGTQGIQGLVGAGLTILGSIPTYTALPGYPSSYGGHSGDGYITEDDGHLWVWNGTTWVDAGNVTGPQGTQGIIGFQGTQGFEGLQGLQGIQGLQGPQGLQGLQGIQGLVGTQGIQGYQGIQGTQGIIGSQGVQGFGFNTVANPVDNRVLTSDGTTNAANAETNMTFNGTTLDITGNVVADKLGVDITVIPVLGVGEIGWNDVDGTLEFVMKGGNVTQQIGQELPILVKHADNTGLAEGKVVYTVGSDGSNMTVRYASNLSDLSSATTFGVMTESATGGAKAFCTTFGLVRGLNTLSLVEGDAIWLSTNGDITTTKPIQPAHLIYIGVCVRSHATQGVIFVKIQNGYELNEIHDVQAYNPATLSNNSLLVWNSTTKLWEAQTGITGPQGTQGITGSSGIQGVQGIIGINGIQGIQGIIGFQGITGTQGTTGTNGSQGTQGIQGVTGDTGAQGTTGSQGAVGATGSQGVIGSTGAQGAVGAQGAIGATGSQGTTGTNGIQGATGAQGTTGDTGVQGANGTQGIIGVQGIQGIQGITGLQGATGVSPGGTTNYVAKFTGATTIGNSQIFDNGIRVGIGTATPRGGSLDVNGAIYANENWNIYGYFLGDLNTGASNAWLSGDGASSTNSFLSFATNATERMRINHAGNVGIGTTNPIWKFVVSKGGAAGLEIDPDNGTAGRIGIYAYNRASSSYMPITIEASSYNFGVGNVGIGTTSPSYPLHVTTQVSNISIYADYDIVAFSDQSVKTNIRPIDNALERVIKSRGVLYDRLDSGQKDNIGFIAQELEIEFPELVVQNNDGTKAVKYQNAVAVLFEAIKEQQLLIDDLYKKII